MPKIVDPAKEKQQLLEFSFSTFARRGYSATTMRQLAKEAKVSTGKFYHYFSSKDDVFHQLVLQRAQTDIAIAIQEMALAETPAGKIERLGAFVDREQEDLCHLMVLLLDFSRQHPNPEAKALTQRMVGFYITALRQQLGESAEYAESLFSSILGSLMVRLLGGVGCEASKVLQPQIDQVS